MGTPFGAVSLAVGQYISRAHHARLDFDIESFSVNLRHKGSAAGQLANKFAAGVGWQLEVTSGGAYKGTVNGTTITGGSGVLDNAWHDVELVVDRNRDRLLLYVDGAAITPVAFPVATTGNAAALQIGRAYDGSSTLTGAIAEFRISDQPRHTEAFTPQPFQFEDDGYTRLLWHFNETKGSTIFDMSCDAQGLADSGVRYDGSLVGGPGTWVYGPLKANPAGIIHESLWYGLDTDAVFKAYADAAAIKRHRARRTDKDTDRIMEVNLELADCPGIFLDIESVSGIPPRTHGIHVATIPATFYGAILQPSFRDMSNLWWLMLRAIVALKETDAGSFLHSRVDNWHVGNFGIFKTGSERGLGTIGRLVAEIIFEMNVDLFTVGTP